MFNNSLFNEEARLKIAERERVAESHRLDKQFGYSDRGSGRLVVALIALVIALVLVVVLL